MERLAAALADRYRVERELGQGGMATVYLAEDLKHRRKVAVKVLKPELAAVLGAERFVQEITTTAALQHPHILPLFDSGEADGFLYYVMPFIDGETLRAKLDRETQLGVDEAVRMAMGVADALDYAHSCGVIHRDIKPENILLANGRPMVADFGIALAVSAAAGGRMTETGLSLGTPHYMSPEQATAEKEIGPRSDVYSLASVLYEMLAGQPPHMGGSAQQIIMKIITEQAAPVTQYRKSVPPHIAAALAQALEKLPADRFASARAFAEALANPAFVHGVLAAVPGAGRGPSSRGRRTTLALGAATALLTVALAGALATRGEPGAAARTPWLVDLGLPDSAGFQNGMALSDDGSVFVYGGVDPDRQIWLRHAGMLTPAPIPGTIGGCCPALSPDAERVAFVRGSDVHVVPLRGGTSTLVGRGWGTSSDDVVWTGDGYLVGTSGTAGLLRVAEGGGAVSPFTTPDLAEGEGSHWSPRALPGGRGILFSVVPWDASDPVGIRIAVVGPEGGAHTVLMPGRVAAWAAPGHLLVLRADGSLVAVPFDLASLRVTGEAVPVLTGLAPAVYNTWLGYFVVASTGRLLYIGGSERPFDLVLVQRGGQVAHVDSSVADLWAAGARISSEGRTVAYHGYLDDVMGISMRDTRTGASSRLEVPAGRAGMPNFSPDGRSLVFRIDAPDATGIYRAEVGRGAQRTLLLADPGATHPSLSPDGHTLYYVRQGARAADFVAHLLPDGDTNGQVLVASISGGSIPRVSPDGRWLAYATTVSGAEHLFVRSTDPGRTERWQITRAGSRLTAGSGLVWARDGSQLHFIVADSMVAAHVSVGETFAVGAIETLFPMQQYTRDFDVAPDGRFLFLRPRPGPSGYRILMIEDWRERMRSR
jgi:eukaryotic-like serine/threonine-protein kinase